MSLDHVIEWGKKLKPPSGASSGKDVTAWRWTVAITLGVTSMGMAVHIALACGLIGVVHPGFASAADVAQIQAERKVERQTDLEQKILEVREKQCLSSGQVKSLHAFTLNKMLVEYQKLSGSAYPVPSCEDFL